MLDLWSLRSQILFFPIAQSIIFDCYHKTSNIHPGNLEPNYRVKHSQPVKIHHKTTTL